jgi:hypothetical protein
LVPGEPADVGIQTRAVLGAATSAADGHRGGRLLRGSPAQLGRERQLDAHRLDSIRDGLGLLPAERRGFWETTIGEAETLPAASFNPNGYVVLALQAA